MNVKNSWLLQLAYFYFIFLLKNPVHINFHIAFIFYVLHKAYYLSVLFKGVIQVNSLWLRPLNATGQEHLIRKWQNC